VSGAVRTTLAALALTGAAASAAPAPPPPVTLAGATARVAAGATATVPVTVRTAAVPRRADVMLLLDTSTSMTLQLPSIRAQVADAVRHLQAGGIDLRVGLALAGTSPVKYHNTVAGQRSPYGDPHNADPAADPDNPAYRPPVLFRRVLPVSPVPAFLAALGTATPEVLPSSGDTAAMFDRLQSQLLGAEQLLTGSGFAGSPDDRFQDAVAPGQVAGWRADGDVARFLVSVTDQEFAAPDGTPSFATVTEALVAQRVRHVGLMVMDYAPGVADLARLSLATGTYVPAAGLRCGGFLGDEVVPGGAPFVCNTTRTALAIETAVRAVPHDVPFALTSTSTDPVLRGLTGARQTVDGRTASTVRAGAVVSCPNVPVASRHVIPVTASYGSGSATGTVTVLCAAAIAAPVVIDDPPVGAVPPPDPAPVAVAPVPVAPAPPAPVVNPNVQPAGNTAPRAAADTQEETEVETAEERVDDPGVAAWLAAAALMTGAAAAYARRTAAALQVAKARTGTRGRRP
jgi:hypothetical protein